MATCTSDQEKRPADKPVQCEHHLNTISKTRITHTIHNKVHHNKMVNKNSEVRNRNKKTLQNTSETSNVHASPVCQSGRTKNTDVHSRWQELTVVGKWRKKNHELFVEDIELTFFVQSQMGGFKNKKLGFVK